MDMQSYLKDYGFDDKEASVYLALLKLGQGSVMDISKKANIKRPTTYLILESLLKRGVIDLLPKRGKTNYIAKSPKVLLDILLRKEKESKSFIPQLMSIFNEQKERPKVMYYEGEEATKRIYDDSIDEGKEILAFFGVKEMFSAVGNKFTREYVNSRVQNEIKAKVIVPESDEAVEYKKRDKGELRQTRLIDSKRFPFEAEVMIYGNKIAIISFRGTDSFGLIIQNDQFSQTIKSVFNFMWANLA
jgi:HTH-type transcriptional regulator, sugar sensing transcriptional regulator